MQTHFHADLLLNCKLAEKQDGTEICLGKNTWSSRRVNRADFSISDFSEGQRQCAGYIWYVSHTSYPFDCCNSHDVGKNPVCLFQLRHMESLKSGITSCLKNKVRASYKSSCKGELLEVLLSVTASQI